MITPYEQLDILLRADFNAGDCLWMRKEGQEFLSAVQEDFIGSGLYLETQKPLYDWFIKGKESFKSGAINWSEFEKRGEELAGKLSSNSQQRFRMFYGKSPQNVGKPLTVYREITEDKKSGPLSDSKNRKVTICFGYPESGWMQMVILANFKHHIIWLSDVFDPFPDMVRWLKGITRGLSETLHIDEEGERSFLTVRTIDDCLIELIIESDHAVDSDDLPIVAAHVVAIVERRQFVEELYRQLPEFLKVRYWEFVSRDLDPYSHDEEQIAKTRKTLIEYLDLSEIRDYLDLDKNLLKPLEVPGKMDHSTDEEQERQAVAILNDILAGKYAWDSDRISDALDQVVAIIEPLALIEKHDALLNLAADYNTVALLKENAQGAEEMEQRIMAQIQTLGNEKLADSKKQLSQGDLVSEMLTPTEIEQLRQNKKDISASAKKAFTHLKLRN